MAILALFKPSTKAPVVFDPIDIRRNLSNQKFGGKGMDKGIAYLNDNISKKLIGYKCTDQSDIDKML